MSFKAGGYLLSAMLAISTLACRELPGASALQESPRQMEPMPYGDAIPEEWGDLISVTADANWTYSTMWFQDDSGTIRLVGFYNENRQLLDSVVVIERR